MAHDERTVQFAVKVILIIGYKGKLTWKTHGQVYRCRWKRETVDLRDSDIDPWKLRDRFLTLDLTDRNAVLTFLRETSEWPCYRGNIDHIGDLETSELIAFQNEMRNWLTSTKPWPVEIASAESDLRLKQEQGVATLSIMARTALEAMNWTVFIDLHKGARFRFCARADCPDHRPGRIPFELSGNYDQKYCSWYCGHIESVRRKRKEARRRDK